MINQSKRLEFIIYRGWEEYASGNKDVIEDIYPDLMPFCLRVCSKICGKYIYDNDEEASIARLAILEAFDTFNPDKGKILLYLGQVIKSRVIDYKRREQKKKIIPLGEPGANQNGNEQLFSQDEIELILEDMARKQDLDRFKTILSTYNIELSDLIKSSPRQYKSREKAKEVALVIADDQNLSKYLLDNKKLPIKLLEEKKISNRKLIDRYRRYIIANALIIINDLTYLKPYVLPSEGGA